ncbi:MAG: ATP-binding cassette domain-containing protein [Pseudomonadota bacterium]
MLSLKSIRIALRETPLIELSADVGPGDILTVMGASGSGKSTLLAMIGGYLDPAFSASGEIWLDGQEITGLAAARRQVGILFQDPLLFPHLSVGQNLLFAVPQQEKGRALRQKLAEGALRDAGLEGYFDRDPATLSGGQQARVALMRVLLSKPKALLLDEPFSKLDTALRDQIRSFVFAEARLRKLPIVMVTHDENDAAAAGGQTISL